MRCLNSQTSKLRRQGARLCSGKIIWVPCKKRQLTSIYLLEAASATTTHHTDACKLCLLFRTSPQQSPHSPSGISFSHFLNKKKRRMLTSRNPMTSTRLPHRNTLNSGWRSTRRTLRACRICLHTLKIPYPLTKTKKILRFRKLHKLTTLPMKRPSRKIFSSLR